MNSHTITLWPMTGGIILPDHPATALQQPIQTLPLPQWLVLPLQGAKPLCQPGDTVLTGQKIAEGDVPVHASSSGIVEAIEPRPVLHASGLTDDCMVIRCDGKDLPAARKPLADYRQHSAAALIEHIREAGITGMGGAGFPCARKLQASQHNTIHTLIINGVECEPYISADDAIMRERSADILQGIQILQFICQAERCIIAIEDNKPEAIAAMTAALPPHSDMVIAAIPTRYPAGGEKQLIQVLTGQQLPSGSLPASIGILCHNVATALAVYQAVVIGEPLIRRVTTISGAAIAQSQNAEIRIGTPISELLDNSGFQADNCQRLMAGGPMMGFDIPQTAAGASKTLNALLATTAEETPPAPDAQACIRCGLCAEACPASLLPQQLFWFSRAGNHQALQQQHLFDCIECGACSYVCPSHIPLVHYYRAAKADIRQQNHERQKAEQAKQRFEARQQRMEQLAEEKAARRAARQQKAQQAAKQNREHSAATDPVQAALERANARQQQAATQAAPVPSNDDQILLLEKRIQTLQQKLADGAQGPAAEVMQRTLNTMQQQLQQLQQDNT